MAATSGLHALTTVSTRFRTKSSATGVSHSARGVRCAAADAPPIPMCRRGAAGRRPTSAKFKSTVQPITTTTMAAFPHEIKSMRVIFYAQDTGRILRVIPKKNLPQPKKNSTGMTKGQSNTPVDCAPPARLRSRSSRLSISPTFHLL